MRYTFGLAFLISILVSMATAQELRVSTVTRPPFSMPENNTNSGFSIDLWNALMQDMKRSTKVIRAEQFSKMLDMVENGNAQAAIANISITANRETRFDFSHPIFESGLRIMVHSNAAAGATIWQALFSKDLFLAIALSFAVLLAGGMIMWWAERDRQDYFNLPARKAIFPSFWWALNLVVNGGFEERVPRSLFGRLFGVLLVISSLFIVSVVVAQITATLTIASINNSVNSVNDLHGKSVGTIANSTADRYLETRNLRPQVYDKLEDLLAAFEDNTLDAVVFDAPILAYYVNNDAHNSAQIVGPVFLRENYGIVLPSGSPLTEEINQSLLRLRENGRYDEIYHKWFGLDN